MLIFFLNIINKNLEVCNLSIKVYLNYDCGMWRSSVAYTHGVRGVAGSNPVIPTLKVCCIFIIWLKKIFTDKITIYQIKALPFLNYLVKFNLIV